jgi:hypothetical protein
MQQNAPACFQAALCEDEKNYLGLFNLPFKISRNRK